MVVKLFLGKLVNNNSEKDFFTTMASSDARLLLLPTLLELSCSMNCKTFVEQSLPKKKLPAKLLAHQQVSLSRSE
ncbi:MAG: hypothetical protein NTZ41_05180 [Sphingobacteriales bacterium]|nr:hypothetical protein [Sphingobacteriales bacterium]